MRVYFSLGYGMICYLYLRELPKPSLWVRDKMVTYCWESKINLGNSDFDRDSTRYKILESVKKL